MGLRDDLQADLAEAFDSDLSDAVTAFIGTRTTANDTDSGVDDWMNPPDTPSASTLTYSGRGVFTDYSTYELNSDIINVIDVKLIVLQNEITAEPIADDKINGYSVVRVSKDPALATFEIQLRQV
jgi:hypothetical protein